MNRSVRIVAHSENGGVGDWAHAITIPGAKSPSHHRGSPPLTDASVLSASRDARLLLFPCHRQPGSQVPYESPDEVHAACGVKPSGLPPGVCPACGAGTRNAGQKAGGKPEGLAPHLAPCLVYGYTQIPAISPVNRGAAHSPESHLQVIDSICGR